jgi:APA family basic amino acid/polyamine antiporter
VITTLSPDAAHPEKDVARAVKFSTILCIGLYILTAVSLCGMARMQDFNAETAMAEAFAFIGIEWASYIIYFCALFGVTAACFTNMLSQLKCA